MAQSPGRNGSGIDYLGDLNEQQREAAASPPSGAIRVIAGAGSGKTRTLTYRVASLLEQGLSPREILLLTFTNKASREMMGRVAGLTGDRSWSIWGGTFHSIGNRFLRMYAQEAGRSARFSIMDRSDARKLVRECVQAAGEPARKASAPKAEVLLEVFSQAANRMIALEEVLERHFGYLEADPEWIRKVRSRYLRRKREGDLMDFDDLLVEWLGLFERSPEAARAMRRRFRYVLVDEYQDTNRLQNEIILGLIQDHGNLMVVGDDSQSIYSWRGADFSNIVDFGKRFPRSRTFRIETNYRSSPEILRLANEVIARNASQVRKTLRPSLPSGPRPVLCQCYEAQEQARFVADQVERLQEEGMALGGMAVLYRSHSHAIEVQMELSERRIPFLILSGVRFFEQAHIKDVLAWLQLVVNPLSELSFRRLAAMLPGIGERTSGRLWIRFREALGAGEEGAPGKAVHQAFGECLESAPRKARQEWASWTRLIRDLEEPEIRKSPSDMIGLILDRSYSEWLGNTYENAQSRLEDVQSMASFIGQYESLEAFLDQMALESNVDAEDQAGDAEKKGMLRLSTIHQSKGLEFDAVFLIMLCDGLFPSARAESLEEERRLFYVAATRARKQLYLSHPVVRFQPGRDSGYLMRSRFLDEIPEDALDEWT